MENIKNILAGAALFGSIGLVGYLASKLPVIVYNYLFYAVLAIIAILLLWAFGKLVRLMFQ